MHFINTCMIIHKMLPQIESKLKTQSRIQKQSNLITKLPAITEEIKSCTKINNDDKIQSPRTDFKFLKQNMFCIVIKSGNITRSYKHGTDEWFKECEYYNGTTNIKRQVVVSQGKLYGFGIERDGVKIWKTKVVTQYYENKKLKSIETFCGNANDNKNDILCGKQYYYRENGNRLRTLKYDCRFESNHKYYKKIISEGLHGLQYNYYENGKKESIESYYYGKKHNWQNFYDGKGKLIKQEIWYDGKLSNVFDYN